MKKVLFALLALQLLAACNTFEGMGKDISNAGDSISDSAERTKEKINNR